MPRCTRDILTLAHSPRRSIHSFKKKTRMTFLSPAHLRVRCPTWLLWQLVRVSLLLCLASLRECMSGCVSEPVGRTGSRIDPKAHLV